VLETLLEAMKATKRTWGTCPGCGQRVELQMQDATAVVNAAKVLMEQAEGRPGVAGEQDKEHMKIVRFVTPDPKLLDLPKWRRLAETGELEALKEAILAAGHEKVLHES